MTRSVAALALVALVSFGGIADAEEPSIAVVEACDTWDSDQSWKCSDPGEFKSKKYKGNSINKQIGFEAFEGQRNCAVTGSLPAEPRSLGFCHKFNEKACCPPVMDDENTEMFNMLTGVGLSCRIRGDIRQDPLAKWYCLNCDPDQPRYVRPAPHDPIAEGSPTDPRDQTLLVCRNWAISEFKADPILSGPANRFEQCALLKSSPCLDMEGNAIDDRDRYMCGDDPVWPSSYKQVSDSGEVLVDESIEAFMNADDMGPPVMNEAYYFKLVSNSVCNSTYLENLYGGLNTTGGEQPQPDCRRSHVQLQVDTYNFGTDPQYQDMTFQDYFCATTEGADCSSLDCKDGATRLSNPCCCARWEEELCFGGASQLFAPTLAAVFAIALATGLV